LENRPGRPATSAPQTPAAARHADGLHDTDEQFGFVVNVESSIRMRALPGGFRSYRVPKGRRPTELISVIVGKGHYFAGSIAFATKAAR
jgi:hypothetical protein